MILSNIFQTMGNKEWIAFANEKKCNHAKSLIKSGFISWVNTANFEVGDIVYLFMSNTRNVRFKTQVVADKIVSVRILNIGLSKLLRILLLD